MRSKSKRYRQLSFAAKYRHHRLLQPPSSSLALYLSATKAGCLLKTNVTVSMRLYLIVKGAMDEWRLLWWGLTKEREVEWSLFKFLTGREGGNLKNWADIISMSPIMGFSRIYVYDILFLISNSKVKKFLLTFFTRSYFQMVFDWNKIFNIRPKPTISMGKTYYFAAIYLTWHKLRAG